MSGWDLGKEVESWAVFLFHVVELGDKGSSVLSSAVYHLPSLAQAQLHPAMEVTRAKVFEYKLCFLEIKINKV